MLELSEATKLKTFRVDARTILQLGRQSIKDNTTALIELVKNSYDADADMVQIEIINGSENQYIRVADNGCGMTETEIDDSWLRIGFSEKRTNRVSSRKRRKTGEKGIGRISADRLGASLELRTRAKDSTPVGLEINWDQFDVEGQDISEVPIDVLQNIEPRLPEIGEYVATIGTELIIRNLRQEWSPNDIRLLYEELSVLTPPFEQVQDFQIYLYTDVTEEYNGLITSNFQEAAEIELQAVLIEDKIQYKINDRTSGEPPIEHALSWGELVQKVSDRRKVRGQSLTGPLSLKLLFYVRSPSDFLADTPFTLGELREFLDRNAGIKIYRDNIRVRPYGDPASPEGDWLGLADRKTRDPAGVSRKTYRFSANQVVGAVFLSHDHNPTLIDSASREGLIHGDAFADLRALTLGCLALMELHRHQAYEKKQSTPSVVPATQAVTSFQRELNNLRDGLQSVQISLPSVETEPEVASQNISRVLDQVSRVVAEALTTEEAIQEAMSQAGVLRGLATIGIASSVFGHETESAVSQILASANLTSYLLEQKLLDIETAKNEIKKVLHYARQVDTWGKFSLTRVKKHKRDKHRVQVNKVILDLLNGISPAFLSASIDLETKLAEIEATIFEMDVEAVVLNLLTNAYVACQQIRRKRVIRLELNKSEYQSKCGFEIIVSDTGPGVSEHLANQIWKPLVTFKKNQQGREEGTGLGLTIVNSIVVEAGGHRNVTKDEDLGGARFTIWLPCD